MAVCLIYALNPLLANRSFTGSLHGLAGNVFRLVEGYVHSLKHCTVFISCAVCRGSVMNDFLVFLCCDFRNEDLQSEQCYVTCCCVMRGLIAVIIFKEITKIYGAGN
jgi:hypothetical protein